MELVRKGKEMGICEKKKNGLRSYTYLQAPPKQFGDIINDIKYLNSKLIEEQDPEKNMLIYQELIYLSQKLQNMQK